MEPDVFSEKLKLFRDARAFKKTRTTPLLSNVTGWAVCDSRFSAAEAYYDPEVMRQVLIEFGQRYQFDGYQNNGFIYMFPVTEALGGGSYLLDKETGAISVIDHNLIFPEEYAAYGEDPGQAMRRAFERKHPDLTTEMFLDAVIQFMRYSAYSATASTTIHKEVLQRPLTNSMTRLVMSPLETLNSALRGIKDLAIDIRRHRFELEAFLEACWEKVQLPTLQAALATPDEDSICDIYTSFLGHAFLSEQQFAELYWPYSKQIFEQAAAAGRTVHIFCESDMLRFYEFFSEIPKGLAIFHVEQDDIREVRKRCPNLCLAGGMPLEQLGFGTPEQCVDTARRLIDDMGEGFIFSTTKLVAYAEDARRENMLAVNEFVLGYEA